MNAEAFERLQVPAPIPTRVSQPFWDAAAGHMLKMQRCEDCRMWVFYPRSHCSHCWSPRLEWAQTSGRGELETFSTVHRPGHPAWQAVAPYPLGLIRLDEGPTMLATLVDVEPDDLYLGMLVEARFVRVGQFTLPMFAPLLHSNPAMSPVGGFGSMARPARPLPMQANLSEGDLDE